MEHQLSITRGRGMDAQGHKLMARLEHVRAETNLGPSPQLVIPESIEGRLPGTKCGPNSRTGTR